MRVRDIMTQPAQTIDMFTTALEAAEVMARLGIGALPVTEEGHIVGIVTDRDLMTKCLASHHEPEVTPVMVFMTPRPITVSPSDTVEKAARMLAEHAVHRLPVTEHGQAVGMLSADDVARFIADDAVIGAMMRGVTRPMGVCPATRPG